MSIRPIIFLFLVASIFYSCSKISTEDKITSTETESNKLEEKAKPSDYWEDKWRYPSTESQAENFKAAIRMAKKQNALNKTDKSGLSSNWRLEGPTNIGGRANCILVDSRDTNTIYIGMAAGGIFKTTDGGGNWSPIADDFAYLSISQIIQDPLYPDTIFASTGDRNFGSWGRIGDGVKVSYDAGATWQASGLDNAGIVSKLLIDSTNRILWASVLGNPRISSNQRGVYKSLDMGRTWQQVHSINNNVGAIDLVIDPFDPQTLYVSYFNRQRTSTTSIASGNDGRIWQTKDGGVTWNMLTNGLPNYPVSRIGLAISSQTPGKLYATVVGSDFNHEGLYRSLDTGKTWNKMPANGLPIGYTGGFGWYFGQVRINPLNDNQVWLLGVEMFTSTDGGNTFIQSVPDWNTYQVHADKHDMVFLSQNSYLLATDGGIYRGKRAINNPNNWTDIDLIPNNQFYRIAINPFNSEVYAGGVQDNGTIEGTFTQLDNWARIFGGDGFQFIYDPVDSNIFYCETQRGNLYAFDQRTGFSNYNFDDGVSFNRNWDMPFIMSRFNRNVLYCLSDKIHRTTQGPVGTFNPVHTNTLDKGLSTLTNSFGSALCESKLNGDLLYAGMGDGKVWRIDARTGLETDISSGLPDRYVTSLTTSLTDPDLVLLTHSGYLDFITTPHIHLSKDKGATWSPINGDLPPFALNDAVILDNTNDSVIFVASDAGVYVTLNGGSNWSRVGGNMPMIPVNDIEIDYPANRLIAGTFARSIQSFDLDSVIIQTPPIILNIGSDTTICSGDTITIGTNTVFSNYTWSTGETTPSISVFNPGWYWLDVQTDQGIVRDSLNLSIYNLPSQISLGNDIELCKSSTLNIILGSNIPNFDTYLWNTGARSKEIRAQDTGTYILRAQNTCNTAIDTIKITYYPSNDAIIDIDTNSTFNQFQFKNNSNAVQSSNWFIDGNLVSVLDSFTYQFTSSNSYNLVLESTDTNACIIKDSVELTVDEIEDYIIPNIFTPNGDGVNDSFLPYGKSILSYKTVVYDIWGAKIVDLENTPWNGNNIGGRQLDNGTYFYQIVLQLVNGKEIIKAGTLNLVR